jgi:hypothetical protein
MFLKMDAQLKILILVVGSILVLYGAGLAYLRLFTANNFFKRQGVVPFDTAIAFISIYGGITGLLGIGLLPSIYRSTLGPTLSIVFDVSFIVAGLVWFFGIGLGRGDLQTFGLVTIIASLFVRTLTVGFKQGLNPVVFNSYVTNAVFITACITRLMSLKHNKSIVQIEEIEGAKSLREKLKAYGASATTSKLG